MKFEELFTQIGALAVTYASKIGLALLTLIIGLWIIGQIVNYSRRILGKGSLNSGINSFLLNLLGVALKVVLLISVASILGIETTSFVAIIGSAGLAVGLALQGSLANFAGSVLILVFKPYRVGDIVDIGGKIGTVKEIQAFNTILVTPDNKTIILPNGGVAGGPIINLSGEESRRLDFVFRLELGADIDKVREILLEAASQQPLALKDPKAGMVVSGFLDNGVEVTLNIWVKSTDFVASYWGILFSLNETVLRNFRKAGIAPPLQVRQVYMHQKNA